MTCCSSLYRKYGKRYAFSVITILTLWVVLSKIKLERSCSHWTQSLGNTFIDEDPKYCKIVKPDKCWYDLFDGYMDATKLIDCTKDPI